MEVCWCEVQEVERRFTGSSFSGASRWRWVAATQNGWASMVG